MNKDNLFKGLLRSRCIQFLSNNIFLIMLLILSFFTIPIFSQTHFGTIIQTGLSPRSITVYEKMNKIFVADSSDKIFVFDGNSLNVIDTISTGITGILEMQIIEKYGKLYASNIGYSSSADRRVVVINADTGDLIKYIAAGNFTQLYKDEELGKIYALLVPALYQIDALTDSVKVVPGISGKSTSSLGINPVTHEIFYTPNVYSPPMTVIDAFTLSQFQVPEIGGMGIAVNWKDNKVYVAYTLNGSSYIYNRNTGLTTQTNTGNDATYMVYNPTGNRIYSSSEVNNVITVIDGQTDSAFTYEDIRYGGYRKPFVCESSNHIYYTGKPIMIFDDQTFSKYSFGIAGAEMAINQSTKTIYLAYDDSIKIFKDETGWELTRPKLIFPNDGSNNIENSSTFTWNFVNGAKSYRLEISDYNIFGQNLVKNVIDIQDTSVSVSGLAKDKTYYWRITAYSENVQSDYSKVFSFTTAKTTAIEILNNETPKDYSLYHNYPNPFNPITKIKFGLPENALTKLIIYDILGREVTILVNEELEAGYHEVDFNASNLSSGVYFYRMQTSDPSLRSGHGFTESKKLILMK